MNYLGKITVENLACFGDLSLAPGTLTLLLGANGTGKSTLLDIVFGLRAIANGKAEGEVIPWPDYGDKAGSARLRIDAVLAGKRAAYDLRLRRASKSEPAGFGLLGTDWWIDDERLSIGGGDAFQFARGVLTSRELEGRLPLNTDRSPLSTVRFPDSSKVHLWKRWADGIWLLRLEPRRMHRSAEGPEDALAISGENFVAWLLSFSRRKERLANISAAASTAVGGLSALELERVGREWVLVAEFTHGARVDFDALSDGQRSLIVLYAVLQLIPRGSLLLLDEPDAHVTPSEILPLFAALRDRTSSAGLQVIVVSHHPHVIDLLAPDTPWELLLEGGKVRAEPFGVDLTQGIPASKHLLLRGRS